MDEQKPHEGGCCGSSSKSCCSSKKVIFGILLGLVIAVLVYGLITKCTSGMCPMVPRTQQSP